MNTSHITIVICQLSELRRLIVEDNIDTICTTSGIDASIEYLKELQKEISWAKCPERMGH